MCAKQHGQEILGVRASQLAQVNGRSIWESFQQRLFAVRPCKQDQSGAHAGRLLGELSKQLYSFGIAPLRVINDDKQRTVTNLQAANFEKSGRQAPLALDQIKRRPIGIGYIQVEERLQRGRMR